MLRRAMLWLLALLPLGLWANAQAQTPPAEIKIGHLHAGSGPFASISMPVYFGLKLWVEQTNASGGAFVKAFDKKIPLRLISYDDQSSTATAATLYNQLITQDKVNILVADSGSVLTSVAVPIARENKVFLFNPTGTGAPFFTKDNPYIALLADPVSTIWPKYIPEFLGTEGAKAGIKRVALIYATNDFTGTQANAIRTLIKSNYPNLQLVYDQGIPTNTSNYAVLVNNMAATSPDAVIALGYVGNDIAFLRSLQDSGNKFAFLFAIYPGLEMDELLKNVGPEGLSGVFTYVSGASIEYKPTAGMALPAFKAAWDKAYPNSGVHFGLNSIAGYTSALVIEQALANAESLDQLAIRKAVFGLSGKLTTVAGTFELDETGAQIGEITPLGQLVPDGKGGVKLNVVYPPDVGNAQPILGKP
jgi:branched-chain amino acid transport system substrate-binding protein